MPGVRKVAVLIAPKFFAADQFKLEWGHFTKSESQPTVNSIGVHAIVAMACEFDFVDKGDVVVHQDQSKRWLFSHVYVTAKMDKSKSKVWAAALQKNTPQQNLELLKHERVHVELAERHARYVFQQVQKLSVPGADMVVACQQLIQAADRIRKDHWNKLEIMNGQYDSDTQHGTNSLKQQQWNDRYLSTQNTNATL